jgi:hypothetical protein
VTALIAKADPVLKALGPIYWVGVGAFAALIYSCILYLVTSSQLKRSEADFNRAMAVPRSTINPLSNSFIDSIIPIEDLKATQSFNCTRINCLREQTSY